MLHTCFVCGYPNLAEPPRRRSGCGSYEICPSCGFQFGVSDDENGHTFEQWRARWQRAGMKWSGRGLPVPPDWDPQAQLRQIPVPPPPARAKVRRRKSAR